MVFSVFLSIISVSMKLKARVREVYLTILLFAFSDVK